eukprot:gene44392-54285_t
MDKGFLVWVRNPSIDDSLKDQLWFPGVVAKSEPMSESRKHRITVTSQDLGTKDFFLPFGAQESDDLKPRNTLLNAEEENLQNLAYLNEPEMLCHLRSRYERSLIFTYTGPILLSINPFDEIVPSQLC